MMRTDQPARADPLGRRRTSLKRPTEKISPRERTGLVAMAEAEVAEVEVAEEEVVGVEEVQGPKVLLLLHLELRTMLLRAAAEEQEA
jgi:hypothetical protein